MGVPGFFRWICQRYPMIKRDFSESSRPIINNLYFDLNGLIHQAITSTKHNGQELSDDFLSELFRLIDLNIQIMKPTNLIFISIDGVVPAAKATQQRKSEFISSKERQPNAFDFCAINPGTEFANQLNQKIIEFIKKQKKKDLLWSKPRIIYSGFTVPGEGEHKIINYIRQNKNLPDWNPNLVHCIPADDADVFFLSLQTHEGYIVLSKNKDKSFYGANQQVFYPKISSLIWSEDDFELIHVSLIREYISIDFNVKGKELELTIDDFIALSFLIGNDFIPLIKDIDISDCYDNILNIYKKLREKLAPNHLVEDGQFNKQFMKEFFIGVVDFLRLKYKKKNKLIDLSIEEVSEKYTQENTEYLMSKFHLTSNGNDKSSVDELIKKMSLSFLDAFDWVLKYYREGCPSWKWFYPYHYAPPLEFVIPFIDEHRFEFSDENPQHPLLHLLSVIPPQSKELLPKKLADLMDCDELKKFYPESFEEDLNNRKKRWQRTILVPIIDFDLLEKKFNLIELPSEILEKLNKIEDPIEFKNEDIIEYIHLSKGEIPFNPICIAQIRPPFIPTFEGINFKYEEKIVPVKIFTFKSNEPSIVIKVEQKPAKVADALNLMDTVILVNWPYFQPAKVIGIKDNECEFDISTKSIVPIKDPKVFAGKSLKYKLWTTQGLDIGEVSLVLTVAPQNKDGSFLTNKSFDVPFNLINSIDANSKTAFIFQPEMLTREPNNNEKVIILNNSLLSSENCVGKIIKKDGDNFIVSIIKRRKFPIDMIMNNERREWIPLSELVKKIRGLSFRGIRQCLKEIIINPFKVNIALVLMTNDRKVIFGCCKYDQKERNFVFPKFILPLFIEYFNYTGSLKQFVMNSIENNDKFNATLQDLFKCSTDNQNKCYQKLINWLSEKAPALNFPLVDMDNDFLSPKSLSILEEKISSFDFFNGCNKSETITVKSSDLMWRMKHIQNIGNVLPNVGQRIVSIAGSGPAPFGEIGTVIETIPNENSATVLFDNVIPFGTKLDGLIKSKRGLKMNVKDIIIVD